MDGGGWLATVYRSQRVKHDWVTNTFTFTFYLSPKKLYAGQEVTVRTRYGTTDWFKTGKGVHQGCILSPCLFNLCAEMLGWMKPRIARRNINSLSCADDTALMAESEEGVRSLLRLKEERERASLKFSIHKTKIMAPGPLLHCK